MACGSSAASERSERTVQVYRRFRCRTCGKFNERSTGLLNRTQYPSDVIALVESLAPAWLVHALDISQYIGL
jgi:putative transposase